MADKQMTGKEMPGKESDPAGMSDPRGMLNHEVSRRGTSPVLVGRAAEMAALEGAFEMVRQGGPVAVLIGGEAGVGKTRLISEFAASARMAGARVLIGGCLELGADGLPFGPFTAMLRDLVREIGADEIIGMLPGSSRAIRELARLSRCPHRRGSHRPAHRRVRAAAGPAPVWPGCCPAACR